ncbi:TPA: DNA polymerase III subunit epsilon, partial [Legionella pneumophila]|nr:DNA polymerase III subunit epsilon [Legionella pneumophila]
MRQIILDTETTGIGPEQGHRVIEIGCIELIDRKLTGNHFHVYLNPQREVDEGAFRVHGISTEFLQDKPLFQDIVTEFLQFVEGSELIIHNAPFDVGFLNSELNHVKWNKTLEDYCQILDTLVLARE